MSVSKDFEELFALLNAHGVKALIVGGHAVAFHAKPRYTKDIDVFVEPSEGNAARLLLALSDFGFGQLGLSAEDFTTLGNVVQLGYPRNRVGLLTAVTGLSFEEAWSSRTPGRYGAQSVQYIGREALIRNKRSAGRPQDLADVAMLEAAASVP